VAVIVGSVYSATALALPDRARAANMHSIRLVTGMHDDSRSLPRVVRALGRRLPLAERATDPELLDGGNLPPAELRRNLADMARLNRLLPGGVRASVAAIDRLVGDLPAPRVLDVGTGAGDMPVAFARRDWRVVAVEPDPAVAAVAHDTIEGADGVELLQADGRQLPFADGAFEVAHTSLVLHHLDTAAAVTVLAEMRRVARLGVVVNDLRRGVMPLAATAVAVVAFARCRTTRHDGLLSVRRAYRHGELDGLLAEAGLRTIARSMAWMPRVVTTAVPETAR
jgi:SAM-dependent methyltransferase